MIYSVNFTPVTCSPVVVIMAQRLFPHGQTTDGYITNTSWTYKKSKKLWIHTQSDKM